ncbi:MAG: hypothetical protein A3F54_00350 [Candidatus Kerfeldbacteria bacterium RIFCSPHIGHO2_12_FULL_48_17]|uniref:Nucleotidyl transferase AbiEii/AbiGii toxin family protein n=1 Tax=Candidatus Kerfeldbacteria bacterium RIFCSPHIGHO2_12_FULL_48_17 TaxID=1798542 RepID=A0A1G2B5Z4_9BACT|nr:MAG: hypothetical protein A3F54_00350 [Candidatus Kerfeldbacteria bacterium RIFCSPHIGHO2_12_FULL_48_17]
MHKEILTAEQVHLLPLVKCFTKDFFLVGGTAIALQIGHRQSIDFDLFTANDFSNAKIRKKITKSEKIDRVIRDETGQYTLIIDGVRLTFFQYPFRIRASKKFGNIIKMPDLLTLAAMKAYALGRRAKWKDYVDLFFIMKDHCSIREVAQKTREIFGAEFNEKMFRVQLAYFQDIDYSEKVIYSRGFEVSDAEVQKALIEFSVS